MGGVRIAEKFGAGTGARRSSAKLPSRFTGEVMMRGVKTRRSGVLADLRFVPLTLAVGEGFGDVDKVDEVRCIGRTGVR